MVEVQWSNRGGGGVGPGGGGGQGDLRPGELSPLPSWGVGTSPLPSCGVGTNHFAGFLKLRFKDVSERRTRVAGELRVSHPCEVHPS